jgi:hypothetical protein
MDLRIMVGIRDDAKMRRLSYRRLVVFAYSQFAYRDWAVKSLTADLESDF